MAVPSNIDELLELIAQEIIDNNSGVIEEHTLRYVLNQLVKILDTKVSLLSPTLTADQLVMWKRLADFKASDFIGSVTTSTVFPNAKSWGFAAPGTYTNADNLVIATGNIGVISFDGTGFSKVELPLPEAISIDDVQKTSTAGLIDTYTISLTNGSTSDFEVTNGKYDIEGVSYVKPAKWNVENYDMTKVRGQQITGDVPLKGYGYVSYVLNPEDKLINAIGYFISSRVPNNTVVAKFYETTDSYENFSPTSPNSTLLAEKTFENFNQNEYGRAWWFLDSMVKVSKNKRLVAYWESSIENSLVDYRIEGGVVNKRELRVNQGLYFLDIINYAGDEPIMALFTNSEIAEIQNNDIYKKIYLPDEIPSVVDVPLVLHAKNFLNVPNPDDYVIRFRNITFSWQSVNDTSGIKNTDFGIIFTPNEAGKTWNMAYEILDKNYQIIAQKKFSIKTYSNLLGQNVDEIDNAGDSLEQYDPNNDTGRIAKTLYSLLANNGSSNPVILPKFTGTKTTIQNPLVKHNGFEGQNWDFFLGTTSPYCINGEINFQTYAASQGVSKLQFLKVRLGINDVGVGRYAPLSYDPRPMEAATSALNFVNIALSSNKGFPSMKILIVLEPNGGIYDGMNSSQSAIELKRKMFQLYDALFEKLGDIPNVHFVYSFGQIDKVLGYNEDDYVHPNPLGYDQCARAEYCKIISLIN